MLRCLGGLDALALLAVLMPPWWMSSIAISLGLAPLPPDPIVGYLARSASVMYAVHGLTVLYISFDVVRYWRLIRFLAGVAVLHGFVMLGIDRFENLPLGWQILEGPCFSATGLIVLWLQRKQASSC